MGFILDLFFDLNLSNISVILMILPEFFSKITKYPSTETVNNSSSTITGLIFAFILFFQLKFPDLATIVGPQLVPIIFQELFIGLTCGLVLSICFASVILAGEKIAATSGLAFAAQIDPVSGAQSPVISQIFQLFLLILFFSLNGHLVIFEMIYKSFSIVPIGGFYNVNDVLEKALSSSNTIYSNAVIIVLPIVSILFFMNLGIGFITKSAPQLNLFSFGFPLTILGTFFALYFSVDALQFVFSGLIDDALGFVKDILMEGSNG